MKRAAKTVPVLALLGALLCPSAAASEARAARAAASNGSATVSQDPLTRQILRRQVLHPNGGVESAVRLADGKTLKLQLVELRPGEAPALGGKGSETALAPLRPDPEILRLRKGPTAAGKRIKKAPEQLEHIDRTRHSKW